MYDTLVSLLESWGVSSSSAASQAEFLTDVPGILFAIWETVYAPALATVFAYLLGLPLGIILVTGEEGGIRPLPKTLMRVLNTVINLLRSVPFLILMLLVIPVSRLIVGTSVGTTATIVPLTVAAAPYVARLVEISLREMDRGVIEAAQAMGCSPWQIITKVLLPECRPSLINGATNASITILGYGAMAGAIGGGGLGKIAINYGYNRYNYAVMLVAVILIVILVQIFQSIGSYFAARMDKRLSSGARKAVKKQSQRDKRVPGAM